MSKKDGTMPFFVVAALYVAFARAYCDAHEDAQFQPHGAPVEATNQQAVLMWWLCDENAHLL